jgi:RNA polymerase sigma-70 factor (ECF subfamily)
VLERRRHPNPDAADEEKKDESSASGSPDIERMSQLIARSVNRFCPPWLVSFQDDIVQNAMVRVLKTLEQREQGTAPPASYIWKVAYTATMDQIRKIRRSREVPLATVSALDGKADHHSDPFRDRAARELGEGIQHCLDRLDEKRRLVVGFHLLGHTLGEIEALLGWKPKTVRNRLYRGMADLRRCLIAKGLRP